jgi:hypothetical protein
MSPLPDTGELRKVPVPGVWVATKKQADAVVAKSKIAKLNMLS